MEISSKKVLEEIGKELGNKETAIKLAKTVEENYLKLYHAISRFGFKAETEFRGEYSTHITTIKKEPNGNQYIEITWRTMLGSNKCMIWAYNNHIEIKEYGLCVFSSKKTSLEEIFTKIYSKNGESGCVRVEELLILPKMILERAQYEHKKLEEERKVGGLAALLERENVEIFNLKAIKKAYCTNFEDFKSVFNLLSEEQKKAVIQEIIKLKETNKEADKWLEKDYKPLADDAWREQFLKENGE